MESLIDALYVYAQENRVSRRLQTLEYRQAIACAEEGWNAFKATLTVEQGAKLDTLLSRESETGIIEDQALFLAGISIGLDLGKL